MIEALSNHAPKQSRSRKTTEALLRVGLRKLEENGIDGLSMSEVAAEAGSSVGSLYFRFGDKNQFVGAILSVALNETSGRNKRLLDAAVAEGWTPEETLRRWVAMMVDVMRERRALLRVMLRHALAQPEAWDPIRRLGHEMKEALFAVLEQARPRITVADWQRRAQIGLQVTNGTLTNMIISDPGPLYFDNDSIKTELADIVVRCIWPD
ncbi:MAG TPA: TetR/AcrR family transcriptional regulator [Candidatus Sulfotelmatobacter sp.]|nr:TetR/AcrR family transcriptional regulator [Candidatus Sulfotelmatobacter sp.]